MCDIFIMWNSIGMHNYVDLSFFTKLYFLHYNMPARDDIPDFKSFLFLSLKLQFKNYYIVSSVKTINYS